MYGRIYGVPFDVDEAIQWLCNNPPLLELNLQCQRRRADGVYNKKIQSAGAIHLAEGLACNSTLETLDLTGNDIGDAGMDSVSNALAGHPKLKTLLVGYNGIKDANLANVLLAPSNNGCNGCLTAIDLSNNGIGDAGAGVLAAALGRNTTLTELRLHNTEIGDIGADKLAAGIAANSTLCVLWLGGSDPIVHDGTLAIGQMLRWRPPPSGVVSFQLRGMSIGPAATALGLPQEFEGKSNDQIVAALTKTQRLRLVAFASALHPRLGQRSEANALHDNLLQLVCMRFCV